MLSVEVRFRAGLSVLTIEGDLQTLHDAELLAESLQLVHVDDKLVVDMNSVGTVSDRCALTLRDRLTERQPGAPAVVVAASDEIRLAMTTHDIDRLASVADTVEAAVDAVNGRA